jgi:hypothetical protein
MNRGRMLDLFPVLLLPTLAERAVSAPGMEALGGRGELQSPRLHDAATGASDHWWSARCCGASRRLGGLPEAGRPASAWSILQRVA